MCLMYVSEDVDVCAEVCMCLGGYVGEEKQDEYLLLYNPMKIKNDMLFYIETQLLYCYRTLDII